MFSLRTVQSSGRYLCTTAMNPLRHHLSCSSSMMQIKMSQTKMLQTKMLHTKMLHTKLQHKSRGIHNISLPVHSEDTVYTRSALAFSRKEAQAQTQKEICALKKKVEEREKVIEEKDAVIEERDAVIEERDTLVKQKNETVKEKNGELQRLGQEVLQKSNMVRRLETEGQALKRADTMMELMGLRERGREAYDPL